MSILGDIVSRIFRHSASPASAAPAGTPSPQSKPASPQAAPPATPGSPVDVAAIMDTLAAQSKEKLDWRNHDQACGKRRKGPERAKELGKFPPSLFSAKPIYVCLGTKRTSRPAQPMSAFGGKADIGQMSLNVCF
jgi:hypothetical protein